MEIKWRTNVSTSSPESRHSQSNCRSVARLSGSLGLLACRLCFGRTLGLFCCALHETVVSSRSECSNTGLRGDGVTRKTVKRLRGNLQIRRSVYFQLQQEAWV